MDKEMVSEGARVLADAAVAAQHWVERNAERVAGCGKSADKVGASLRRQTRLLRKLRRAAGRRMCVGVFGPSQAGKSYLLSSLAADDSKKVPCCFFKEEHDFLGEINPIGEKESTGLVTRFTMAEPDGVTAEFPVHVRLLSEMELAKIFINSYFGDCEHKDGISDDVAEEIRHELDALSKRAGKASGGPSLDELEELREYVSNSFGGIARASELDRVYWKDAIELAPRLPLEDRARLYGLIWGDIPEFTEMFLELARDLEKAGNPDEAFFSMDALIPREASIIDVDTLGKKDFSTTHVSPMLKMRTPDGKIVEIARKNATAIVAELTIVMKQMPAPYFAHTDLLDFPGYKARLECSDIADYLRRGKDDSKVEQFFRRGKVAYLFQRYNSERELTSLLLCVSAPDNTPGLPAAVEEWIISTHGKTPQQRGNVKNALFYILTKSDRYFEKKGDDIDCQTQWDAIVTGRFISHFGRAYSQTTKWVDEWTPGSSFRNLFMLRNIKIKWSGVLEYEKNNGIEMETGLAETNKDFVKRMKDGFLASRLVKTHFANPEAAFDALLEYNDGGIGLIKRSLEPVCDPELKLGQIANALETARQELVSTLAPFYRSGDEEQEREKKKQLFGSFGKLFQNPCFRDRFPELLNKFKIPPEQLYYLHADAERMHEDFRKKVFAPPVADEAASSPMAAGASVPTLDDVLGFLDETAQAADSEPAEDSGADRDEAYFYAQRIVEDWSARMRALAETADCVNYYCFPRNVFLGMLDEFEQAVERVDLRGKMKRKFREIDEPVDVPRESKIRKQASYAIGLLNDFVSWMGMNPAETNESQRQVEAGGGTITVFKNRPPVEGFPVLPEKAPPVAMQWFKDWLATFHAMLMDNVNIKDGNRINAEENARIGKIINQVNEARVN